MTFCSKRALLFWNRIKAGGDFFMLGYVHLTAGRPVLERRAAAGMTY